MNGDLRRWGPLPLRLMLGMGFLVHGWPKVFSAQGHEMFVGMLTGIGVPMPGVMAWVVGILEVGGALALFAGAFVRLVTVPLIINMIVAAVTVHLASGFSWMNVTGMENGQPVFGMPGYEIPLLYMMGLASLLLTGAGAASVDEARAAGGAAPASAAAA